jgi:hypothetical protein
MKIKGAMISPKPCRISSKIELHLISTHEPFSMLINSPRLPLENYKGSVSAKKRKQYRLNHEFKKYAASGTANRA